jgi:LysM repeat protein
MTKILPIIFLILCVSGLQAKRTTDTAYSESSAKTVEYTVKSGDSLYTIAHFHHITIDAIRKANALKEGSLIRPGQRLKIPLNGKKVSSGKETRAVSSFAERVSSGKTYRVEAGDTLSGIAQKNGVSTRDLRKANSLDENALIRVGQVIKIPSKSTNDRSGKSAKPESVGKNELSATKSSHHQEKSKTDQSDVHVVESGDTLFSIARKYHTSLKDIIRINGISPTDVIKPGQKLKIPGNANQRVGKASPRKIKERKKEVKAVIYTVKRGDSLWAIANRNETTVKELRRLNKLSGKDVIHTGMKLVVRKAIPAEKGRQTAKKKKSRKDRKVAKTYIVKKGDTLWLIARRNKTTVSELRKLNKMTRKDVIHKGMRLTVGYEIMPKDGTVKNIKSRDGGKKKRFLAKTKKESGEKHRNRILSSISGKGGHYSSRAGNEIIRTAKRYLGRRYVWGAEGPSSFDCSGFTQYVMKKSKGVTLPRVSRKQAYYGKYVSRRNLKPGDLIFFDTSHRRRGYVNHVGIYIGNDKFIHASSARHRVVITSLNSMNFFLAIYKSIVYFEIIAFRI